jgi:putative ABC transport system substrate-binding protein
MRRREFIKLVGGTAAAWSLTARAQQAATPVIGFLQSTSPGPFARLATAFRQGLREYGYVEGRNLAIEYRWAEGHYDRLPALAADLVGRNVNVIATTSGMTGAIAAKSATSTIPIVFTAGGDVIKAGLVSSLNRPGGNVTGVNLFTVDLEAKKLDLAVKLMPTATTIAFLLNPNNPAQEGKAIEMKQSARTLDRQLRIFDASSESEVEAAFATLIRERVSLLIVSADPFFDENEREHLVALSARHSVPAIYGQREYVVAGGLISYGTSLTDAQRQAGIYTARILHGEKPADMPIMRPTKFELTINLKTAKALGLDIPPGVLAIADDVIE